MGIEVQAQTCQPTPNQGLTFTFQNPVMTWVVGLGHFFLTYGPTTNHWIETLSIGLGGSMDGKQVNVAVAVTMMDHTGHMLDGGSSNITVVCVAQTGSSDQNTVLTNVANVTPTQGQQVTLPGAGSDFSVLETCLSGLHLGYNGTDQAYQIQSFNVQYASGDHGVQWLKVGCPSAVASGDTVTLGPCEASTTDGHGNYSDGGESSVDLLVVAIPPPASA